MDYKMVLYEDSQCELGEGPLWHPLRQALFWFDIVKQRLYTRIEDTLTYWQFDQAVSAAGWVDQQILLIASETSLFTFDVETQEQQTIVELEADNALTRSNDGRADPWGGFWIGTMGKNAESKAGSIYRFYKGELRQLVTSITIPNAICFSPDKKYAYFADTAQRMIWRQALHFASGWPAGEPETFIDLTGQSLNPDGSVCDANGNLWVAMWGASKIICFTSEGRLQDAIHVPSNHVSCPAFGGDDLHTLFVTTARQGLSDIALANKSAGSVYFVNIDQKGQREHQVLLG